ncbi:MAG: A/G-specific adenine glycosylase [Pseudomonadota bacterium]
MSEPPDSNRIRSPGNISRQLLAWYDRHRRTLPWRVPAGQRADPYHVWLSEIMLQQTTVATVGSYFRAFLDRWPTVDALAAADREDVLRAWAGLGYYARARNLHACAQSVVADHGSRFPDSEPELRRLPGIGEYTAAAIAAIAFDRSAVVIDGNIERVVARLFAVTEALPSAKPNLKRLTASISPQQRPGDFAQAMMDLGATVCTPRQPKCLICPLQEDCKAGRLDIAETLPKKQKKAAKPTRRGVAFWLTRPDGAVLLRQRPDKGLLGGMLEIPSSAWMPQRMPALADVAEESPLEAPLQQLPGVVRHTFTHFHLELTVAAGRIVDIEVDEPCRFISIERLGDEALPTVMRKVAEHALRHV